MSLLASRFTEVKPARVESGWRADFTIFQEGPGPCGAEASYQGDVYATRELAYAAALEASKQKIAAL